VTVRADQLPDSTPVLVGAGQVVERDASDSSHMALAAQAAGNAISDTGAADIAAHIDTLCVTRLFSDMGHLWPCKWGRSDNPPQSVAQAIGATPAHRIYTQTGGNEPQSRLIEFARDIARGERSVVLLTGAEALKNQRHAERNQRELDWNEHFTEALDDREIDETWAISTTQELKNGLNNVIYYYALIEQAQRHKARRSVAEHRQAMATLLESFSAVASANPYAQFAGKQSAESILAAPALTHLYTKRMIAQDGVNQGAALLMCSIAKARELGIPESNWVYIHGLAEGSEPALSLRPDPAISPTAGSVADRALAIAGLGIDDIDLIDIYSCFPCAVTAVAAHLGLPTDGSRPLTLTGGLPYFGGPGNNYSMHGLVEAVWQARQQPDSYAMVTTNGGVLSKHATGIYSRLPSAIDWANTDTTISSDDLPRREVCADPGTGSIVSYTVHHDRDGGAHAIILGETERGERFVSITAKDDLKTAAAMLSEDPTGKPVVVTPPEDERLHFQLA
jgi:acetyl-CoA C-acetyltransferase